MPKSLTPQLEALRERIEGYARDYGLDFFPTVFEVLSSQELNMVASYGGFPTRYPHWRWGMEYEQLSKGYEYGLQQDLRARDQQRPLLRVPDGVATRTWTRSWSWPTSTGTATSSRTTSPSPTPTGG